MSRRRAWSLPRPLHPGAWWIWALGLATAASRTTNPLLLILVVVVAGVVVSARRGDAPWSTGFRAYLMMGLLVIAIRVGFRMLLDGQHGTHVLFTLPHLPLPEAVRGIQIGGPVSAEGLLAALYDGMRLAALLICVGAANVLANPKRLLKSMPGALHEVGVALTVALTFAPQLVESGKRVHRARRLRGEQKRRLRLVEQVLIPVMTDALDRSLALAAAMDSRGYGRVGLVARRTRVLTGLLVLVGLLGLCVGSYGLLDTTAPRPLGLPILAIGLASAGAGFLLGGRRVQRTRYRPDPWRIPEWCVSASGVAVAAVLFVTASIDPDALNPSLQPLQWPALPVVPALGILLGLLPAWVAPPVRSSRPAPSRPPATAAADHGRHPPAARQNEIHPPSPDAPSPDARPLAAQTAPPPVATPR